MPTLLSRPVPDADSDQTRASLEALGFQVTSCLPDPLRRGYCTIVFSDPHAALAAAAPGPGAPAVAADTAQDFKAKALSLSSASVETIAARLELDLPALWAVLKVETSGCGFLPDRRPKILFERHWFHRLTHGRFDLQAPDVSQPTAGGYGASGARQYDRLEQAMRLDRDAALQSASWGLGQIMGFNAAVAGYANAQELAQACALSEDRQLAAVAAFIAHQNLGRFLKVRDWTAFAKVYNGPAFRDYDSRLNEAHRDFLATGTPDLDIRRIQLALMLVGLDPKNPIDGQFGQRTRNSLQQFQQRVAIPASGERDAATLSRLWSEAGWT